MAKKDIFSQRCSLDSYHVYKLAQTMQLASIARLVASHYFRVLRRGTMNYFSD